MEAELNEDCKNRVELGKQGEELRQGAQFGVDRVCVIRWRKARELIFKGAATRKKFTGPRRGRHPTLEQELCEFVRSERCSGFAVTTDAMQTKALEIATRMQIPRPTRVADAEPLLASNNSAALDTIGCRPQVATCSRGHYEKTADKGNIVNLSDAVLTREETNILSKRLTFCPTTGHYNEFQLYQDLDKFALNMRLREYFHDRQPNPNQMILTNPEKQRASSFIHIFPLGSVAKLGLALDSALCVCSLEAGF
ncbi:hypothetical protein HPB47_018731 [Ixodes persulcatus]|uniref:Uncharacterized protein n=1 Tax=Ixodes persulcatus TaxID=34615 RepID=A0AC60R241_IXOPE|nr:hypothetical protein HPB47_018731 [Ixodes persulcatus]